MAEQRFGGDIRVYGKGFVEQQGTGGTAIVARALLDTSILDAKSRSSHTGTQLFATISDGPSYVDGRIQQIVGAAPAALDTLEEIAAALAADESAADALTNQVATNRADLDAVTGRVTQAESDITDLRGDVDALSGTAGTLATQASVDALSGRVTNVETVAAAAATSADLSTLAGRVSTAEGRLSTAEGRLDGLDGTTAELRTDIDALEARVADSTAVDALVTRVDGAETDIDALQAADLATDTRIGTLEGRVSATEIVANAAATQIEFDQAVADLTAAQNALDARIDALEIPTIFKATVGDGATSVLPVSHNLNSTDIELIVRDLTDGQRVFPVDIVTGANTISLDFGSYVPAANSIRVIVKAL